MKNIKAEYSEAREEFMSLGIGGFDALTHTTVNELFWLVRHELDLYEEGEETDILTNTQAEKAHGFLVKWGE